MIARLLLSFTVAALLAVTLALTALFGLRPGTPRPLLAFIRLGSGSAPLLLRDLDGGRELALPGVADALNPAWSPDGRWLAYVEKLASGQDNLYVYNLYTGLNQYLATDSFSLFRPVWTPDSRWLLYQNTIRASYAVEIVGSVAGGPRPFASGLQFPLLPVPGNDRLYALDLFGALTSFDTRCLDTGTPCVGQWLPGRQPLTALVGSTPDGGLLALAAATPGERPLLHRLDTEGGGLERLLVNAPIETPAWSPDGALLAVPLVIPEDYGVLPDTIDIPGLYMVDSATGEQIKIWHGVAGQLGWTPQGDRLVFEAFRLVDDEPQRSLHLYERTSGEVTRLTMRGVRETYPAWVTYPGRPFAAWLPLLVSAGAAAAAWRARRSAGPNG